MNRKDILLFLLITVFFPAGSAQSQEYQAVLIGIDDYQYLRDLTCCENDVDDMYTFLRTHQNWDIIGEFNTLKDSYATKTAILTAISGMDLDASHMNLFYFAGHGDYDYSTPYDESDGLCPYEYDPNDKDAIKPEDLEDEISDNGSNNRFGTILDACHSGIFPDYMTYGVNCAACDDDEVAGEGYTYNGKGHGYYTAQILSGLYNNTADDGDAGDYVSVEEVHDYAEPRVKTLTSNYQNPNKDDNYSGELDLDEYDQPATPTGLSITNPTSTGNPVQLSWTDNEDKTDYFNVYRKTGAAWSCIGTSETTSYTDFTVTIGEGSPDPYYTYSVTVVDTNNYESLKSNVASTYGDPMEKRSDFGEKIIPNKFGLSQNFPNPFNPITEIRYQLPKAAFVTITVYNVTGQEVAKLVESPRSAGFHSVKWDASNSASGTYFYRIVAGNFTQIRKMVVIK